MNTTLKTILIVLGVILVAGGLFIAGSFLGQGWLAANRAGSPGYAWSNGYAPGMMYGRGDQWQGPGRMHSWGGYEGFGPGMMGGGRAGGFGPGMMRGYGWNNAPAANATPLTVDQARQAAQTYLQSLNLSGLEIGEIMVFDNNAYVVIKETSTGMGAFELLVDPVSKVAYPEYGPNMMWNLKYGGLNHVGMMGGNGGMMGRWSSPLTIPSDVSADMPITPENALKDAQAYLDQYRSGTTASADPVKFYGYYTFDFTRSDKVEGMLSVNGYTGQVFLHTWHGSFIEEAQ